VRTYQPVWKSVDVNFAMRVLGSVQQDFAVDTARVYLTGVSTGAKAAWHALYRHADVFAAAIVVAGVVRPSRADGTRVPDPDPVVPDADGDPSSQLARVLRATPIWTFHGDDDPVFPVSDAREVMAALTAQGAPVRYTELPGFGHDVWDVAYYSNDVADWLFAQSRQG
jgi:predicted peptidase